MGVCTRVLRLSLASRLVVSGTLSDFLELVLFSLCLRSLRAKLLRCDMGSSGRGGRSEAELKVKVGRFADPFRKCQAKARALTGNGKCSLSHLHSPLAFRNIFVR